MQFSYAAVYDLSGCEITFFTNIVTVFSPLSCFGFVSSLNGEPEKGIAVEVCWCFINFVSKNQTFCSFVQFFAFCFPVLTRPSDWKAVNPFKKKQFQTTKDNIGYEAFRSVQSKWLNSFFLIVCGRNSAKHLPLLASSWKENRVFTSTNWSVFVFVFVCFCFVLLFFCFIIIIIIIISIVLLRLVTEWS